MRKVGADLSDTPNRPINTRVYKPSLHAFYLCGQIKVGVLQTENITSPLRSMDIYESKDFICVLGHKENPHFKDVTGHIPSL